MSQNNFEKFVNDASAYKAECDAIDLQKQKDINDRENLILALNDLNDERFKTHEGHDPEELWGTDIAKLCVEFLAFAIQESRNSDQLLASEEIGDENLTIKYVKGYSGKIFKKPIYETKISKIGWSIDAYPIAYSDFMKPSSTIIKSRYDYPIIHNAPTAPKQDIFLCSDGLIRFNAGPLEIVDFNRNLKLPKFMEWDCRDDMFTDQDSSGLMEYVHRFTFIPTEIDPVAGLQKALQNHALRIHELKTKNKS